MKHPSIIPQQIEKIVEGTIVTNNWFIWKVKGVIPSPSGNIKEDSIICTYLFYIKETIFKRKDLRFIAEKDISSPHYEVNLNEAINERNLAVIEAKRPKVRKGKRITDEIKEERKLISRMMKEIIKGSYQDVRKIFKNYKIKFEEKE